MSCVRIVTFGSADPIVCSAGTPPSTRRTVELRHLRYLVAIADAGTFVRAAEVLRVAQPALTRQIHDLEKELDVELFDAGARKATLTPAGEACVRLARHVIQDTQAAVARARMSNKGLAGRCVLVTGPLPLLSGLTGRLLARMKTRHAGISMVVREGTGRDQWEALSRSEVDIALGVPPPSSYPMLSAELQQLHNMNMVALAPEHPLAKRDHISVEDLRGFQFLSLEPMGTEPDNVTQHMAGELRRRKFVPGDVREFPSLESLYAHVRAGQGWAFLPPLMKDALPPLVGVTLDDFQAPMRTMRVWRRADTRPVVHTVLNELRWLQHEDRDSDKVEAAAPDAQYDQNAMPVRLELRHLRSFADLAKYGSMGRAAETIGITQPALSRQMRDLEYDVGVELLERGTRGVELSTPGQGFLDDVRSVLSIVDHIDKEVHRAQRGTSQRCVVGVVPHPHIDRLVARAMADLESRGSRVRMGTRFVGTPYQAGSLIRSELDIAIGFAYPARVLHPEMLARVRLFDDELSYALLPASHPLAQADELSLADLRDVPFLFAGRETFPPVYDVIMHQFSAAGARPRVDAEYEGVHTIWALTGQGLGWSLGLREQVREPPQGTIAIRLRDFRLPWGGELVYRKDESRAAVLAAIDFIIDCARQLFPTVTASNATLPPSHTSETAIS